MFTTYMAISTYCLAMLAAGFACDGKRPPPEIPPPMYSDENGVYLDEDGVRSLIVKYFPKDVDVDLAIKIARCESNFRLTAVNTNKKGKYKGSKDLGLWQINDTIWANELKGGDWRDPDFNSKIAALIYRAAEHATGFGWNWWSCYTKGMV